LSEFINAGLNIEISWYVERVENYRAFHNVLRDYIYNRKNKGPTLMEFFTATGELKFFFTTRDVRNVTRGAHIGHL